MFEYKTVCVISAEYDEGGKTVVFNISRLRKFLRHNLEKKNYVL
jgi:hypothetical protein